MDERTARKIRVKLDYVKFLIKRYKKGHPSWRKYLIENCEALLSQCENLIGDKQ